MVRDLSGKRRLAWGHLWGVWVGDEESLLKAFLGAGWNDDVGVVLDLLEVDHAFQDFFLWFVNFLILNLFHLSLPVSVFRSYLLNWRFDQLKPCFDAHVVLRGWGRTRS
jgi:hypothetical protein